MSKFRIVTLTLFLAGFVLVFPAFAQQKAAAPAPERPTVNQLVAHDDVRIARLKADLRLKQEQEGAWAKLESAMRDIARKRAERFLARLDESEKRDKPLTLIERLRVEAEVMAQRAVDLKRVADAAEPLFGDNFDDRQKRLVSAMIGAHSKAAWRGAEFFEEEVGNRRRPRRGG
jgi:hypothetical protein